MSRFLESGKCRETPMCLHKEGFFYLLNEKVREFHPNLKNFHCPKDVLRKQNGEVFHVPIENSNHKLRMYGSLDELSENINIFKSFPGNAQYFGLINQPNQTNPTIYKNLKRNEKYIAKSDLFAILQNMICQFPEGRPIQVFLKIIFYLRCRQNDIEKCVDFVKFDEERFEKMYEEMKEEFPKRELSPGEQLYMTHALVEDLMNAPAGNFSDLDEYTSLCRTSCIFISILGTVIDKNPDLFLPRRSDSKKSITLRVFEDGDQQFLMKSEVSDALIANSTLKKRFDKEDDNYTFYSITLEEVLKNFDTKNIEFIRYPILRAKHRATPIQVSAQKIPNEFCIFAIDAFFEFFNELFFGSKYFQEEKSNLQDVFTLLKDVFDLDCSTPYFLRCDEERFNSFMSNSRNDSAKNIRNAKSDGFTLQNLKNELTHLGLTTTFPEIQNFTEVVYFEVDKRKKEKVLRTCDLFDAVEQCQLNCVLERLPTLKKFVHNQKGCHRVYGLKCEACAAKNPESQEDQKLKILEKELEDLKIAHQKILDENQQKSLEIQELRQKNLKMSVKNETNEVKMKQLTDKLAQSKLSIDEGNYSNACTSQQKIQCLICERAIESGEDQIIRCPLCKRRFHSKCAINWLKEHTECPACNGNLPKL
ncbi:unnamed protein product [Caenorhabditis nigoni]